MNLKPAKREVLAKTPPLIAIIEEFKKMDAAVVEIENYPHKTAESCASSFTAACRRLNCGVKAKCVDGKPYLYKEEVK